MKSTLTGVALILAVAAALHAQAPRIESRLEILTVATGEREIVWSAPAHFEAPNWSRDGKSLLFNQGGRIFVLPLGDRTPRLLDTGTATRCNNDHGLSPDGAWLAISHAPERISLIYVVPAVGGQPRLVTPNGPSYWHGWSPDGHTLAYCAKRNGEYDIYTIPAEGGDERRLTTAPGLDDGPDYGPDGRIWFNSVRTGVDEDLADGPGRGEPDADDAQRGIRRLVPASVAGRHTGGLSLVRSLRRRPSGEQGRGAPRDAGWRRRAQGGRAALRRPGHDQRAVLVARQPAVRVRELPAPARVSVEVRRSASQPPTVEDTAT